MASASMAMSSSEAFMLPSLAAIEAPANPDSTTPRRSGVISLTNLHEEEHRRHQRKHREAHPEELEEDLTYRRRTPSPANETGHQPVPGVTNEVSPLSDGHEGRSGSLPDVQQ